MCRAQQSVSLPTLGKCLPLKTLVKGIWNLKFTSFLQGGVGLTNSGPHDTTLNWVSWVLFLTGLLLFYSKQWPCYNSYESHGSLMFSDHHKGCSFSNINLLFLTTCYILFFTKRFWTSMQNAVTSAMGLWSIDLSQSCQITVLCSGVF